VQDVPDCRWYAVIFPFTDDQPCCSVEDCLKLTQMNVVSARQYPVAVIYPANNQGVHQNRRGLRRQGPAWDDNRFFTPLPMPIPFELARPNLVWQLHLQWGRLFVIYTHLSLERLGCISSCCYSVDTRWWCCRNNGEFGLQQRPAGRVVVNASLWWRLSDVSSARTGPSNCTWHLYMDTSSWTV